MTDEHPNNDDLPTEIQGVPDEAQLETELRDYLRSELDHQLGKSVAFFRREGARPTSLSRRANRLRWAAVGLAAAALVAVGIWRVVPFGPPEKPAGNELAGLPTGAPIRPRNEQTKSPVPDSASQAKNLDATGGQPLESPGPKTRTLAVTDNDRIGVKPSTPEPALVEQVLGWRTTDEGIVMIDDRTPMRKLRRQWLQRIKWLDEQRGVHMEMIVPREEVVFVAMPML